jgi:excinuclease ABC subunit B
MAGESVVYEDMDRLAELKSRRGVRSVDRWRSFEFVSEYEPSGSQPEAIDLLCKGLERGEKDQVLLGVTGSGKTYTMAQVIAKLDRPALILASNKTLAAQLYGEMKGFFPKNAVEYFVSYYDYYQPEAYVARKDLFIEKELERNEQVDRMRHSATRSLFERNDVIVVASVSCIYGIGSPEDYSKMIVALSKGMRLDVRGLMRNLTDLHYKRNDVVFQRGHFRLRGDSLELCPSHLEDRAWRLEFFGDELESVKEFDPLTGETKGDLEEVRIYANSHYVTPGPTLLQAIDEVKKDLRDRKSWLESQGKAMEAYRLEQRISFDLEMMTTTGVCPGIENYSRYLTGRERGSPPPTLLEYLPDDALLFVDESHVTVPQLGGMSRGDYRRKVTLSDYGFRLPSCMDNRPLTMEEWDEMRPQTVFVSATPGDWELGRTSGEVVEQVVRPTGLLDPCCEVRPVSTQVDDLLGECRSSVEKGHRVLVTTLTKKMAEMLTDYMQENGVRVRYLHSEIDTIERVEIIRDLRLGVFDVLVGINLLREGLDIPECALVAILDADKEGFLRSKRSLVQTMGRAARHKEGRVILYADKMTESLEYALSETERRRELQRRYNEEHGIEPTSVVKDVAGILGVVYDAEGRGDDLSEGNREEAWMRTLLKDYLEKVRSAMEESASGLDFESAALYRDELLRSEGKDFDLPIHASGVNWRIASELLGGVVGLNTGKKGVPLGGGLRGKSRRRG